MTGHPGLLPSYNDKIPKIARTLEWAEGHNRPRDTPFTLADYKKNKTPKKKEYELHFFASTRGK